MKMTDWTPGGTELLAKARELGLDVTYTNLTGGKLVVQYRDRNGNIQSFRHRGPERRKEVQALLNLVEMQHEALELAHLRLDGDSHLVAKSLVAFEEWNKP